MVTKLCGGATIHFKILNNCISRVKKAFMFHSKSSLVNNLPFGQRKRNRNKTLSPSKINNAWTVFLKINRIRSFDSN